MIDQHPGSGTWHRSEQTFVLHRTGHGDQIAAFKRLNLGFGDVDCSGSHPANVQIATSGGEFTTDFLKDFGRFHSVRRFQQLPLWAQSDFDFFSFSGFGSGRNG
jgi:hypothetical protein